VLIIVVVMEMSARPVNSSKC